MADIAADVERLNLHYLMLARECARHCPMEASWRFGLDARRLKEIAGMSMERVAEVASCGRAIISIIPFETPANVSASTHAALLAIDLPTGNDHGDH